MKNVKRTQKIELKKNHENFSGAKKKHGKMTRKYGEKNGKCRENCKAKTEEISQKKNRVGKKKRVENSTC